VFTRTEFITVCRCITTVLYNRKINSRLLKSKMYKPLHIQIIEFLLFDFIRSFFWLTVYILFVFQRIYIVDEIWNRWHIVSLAFSYYVHTFHVVGIVFVIHLLVSVHLNFCREDAVYRFQRTGLNEKR